MPASSSALWAAQSAQEMCPYWSFPFKAGILPRGLGGTLQLYSNQIGNEIPPDPKISFQVSILCFLTGFYLLLADDIINGSDGGISGRVTPLIRASLIKPILANSVSR